MTLTASAATIGYLLYLRKSNGRKAVPRQRSICTGHAAREGGVILETFTDADRTAYRRPGAPRPERPDFDRLIAVLRSRKGLRVLAWHADRLVRDEEDARILSGACREGGHLIETATGGIYDLSTATGRKRLRDDASDAEYEVDHLRERTLAGRDDVAREGRWLGGRRPFGWEPDSSPAGDDGEPLLDEDGKPVRGILRLVPPEAAAIRDGSAGVLAGRSVRGITRQWRQAGLTGTKGGPLYAQDVRAILMRPRNAGLMEHRGEITGAASWPAIVDEGTWRAVRDILAAPGRRTNRGTAVAHLLSGIALCGVCGAAVVVTSASGAGRPGRRVYRCRSAARGNTGSAHVARDETALEGFIAALVRQRMKQDDARHLLRPDTGTRLEDLRREHAELEVAMRASNDLRKQKLLTLEEFAAERREHQERAARLDEAIGEASRTDVVARMLPDPDAAWEDMDLEERRAVVSALLYVTVFPGRPGRPAGWRPGQPYFDYESIDIRWRRRLPSDG